MEEPPSGSPPPPAAIGVPRTASPPRPRPGPSVPLLATFLSLIATLPASAGDALERVRATGRLTFGCDMEGGGPYAYLDPDDPGRVVGFEVELMDALAGRIGAEAVLSQGQWDQLLNVLAAGNVDTVVNGYELLPVRARDYLASRPYYIYQLQLMVREGSPIRSWDDLTRPRPGGGRWRVGVLGASAAETFAREEQAGTVEVRAYTGATDAMMQVASDQLDATLQDLPAARFYGPQYPSLESVGPPVGRGYYVIYLRKGDAALADALDRGIGELIADGTLERIYRKYDIWTDAQEDLELPPPDGPTPESVGGWALVWKYRDLLLRAAGTTIFLSVASMPIAILIGLLVALGRMYGPSALKVPLAAYVELIRGTPLMLQLFVLFYLVMPAVMPPLVAILPPGWRFAASGLAPYLAGIAGLAINYSAYEAEIYRAGLNAVPKGQLEAAEALGMSRRLALRRVIVPQAVRIVIPPVTNDFIALFKDSSVCSVITIVELSKQYQILANSTGGVVEFAAACALMYLAMSLPLSWLSRWSEDRLMGGGTVRLPKRRAPG